MSSTPSGLRRHLPAAILLAMCAAAFAWLFLRNHGLGPAIFADEWYYSKMARLMPLDEAIVPSYLYLWLFRASNACGTGFLDCVRAGNEAFFVAAAPFVYLVARRVAGTWMALFVALLSLLAPLSLYTTFFMPEAMYYFGFAVLSWIVLARGGRGWVHDGVGAGIVLGLMSLVKVHALFLLPALCLYLLLAGMLQDRPRWFATGLATAVLAASTTVLVKFGAGYLLAGSPALSLFGSFYGGTASSNSGRPLLDLLRLVFINGRGHLMALAVLAALPLAMLVQALLSRTVRARLDPALLQTMLFAFLTLGCTAGLAIVYTASIAGAGPNEVLRLHLRYYNFVFPLLLAIAAAFVGKARPDARSPLAWPIAALLAVLVVLAATTLPAYSLSTPDAPDIETLHVGELAGRIAIGLDVAVLLLWAVGSRLAAPLFLFAAVPLMTALGLQGTSAYVASLAHVPVSDRAGIFARDHVPQQERGLITVAATDIMELMRTQFFIDDAGTAMLDLQPGAPVEPYQIPLRNKWLLVVGKHPLPAGIVPVAATDEFALVRVDTRRQTLGVTRVFDRPLTGPVARIDGISWWEPWGRWSTGKHVVLHLAQPLPKDPVVILKAQAFGPSASLPFVMRIGGKEQAFRVSTVMQDVVLRFAGVEGARTITIDVPQPTAPHDVGPSIDVRKLGIGLAEIEIAVIAP